MTLKTTTTLTTTTATTAAALDCAGRAKRLLG
jgi:hypothetical protein